MITLMTDDAAAAEMAPLGPSDRSLLAERLVTSAQGQGIRLTGEDGLLTALTRQVLKAALEAEMAQHLGFERGDPVARDATNIRNGAYPKTVRTEIGEVTGWLAVGVAAGMVALFLLALIQMLNPNATPSIGRRSGRSRQGSPPQQHPDR
jgi:hypothetical protein